jgi:hypothetical protein
MIVGEDDGQRIGRHVSGNSIASSTPDSPLDSTMRPRSAATRSRIETGPRLRRFSSC